VVCGGFGLPIARDMCQKVIVVGSNDLQSLYVANNVCSAVEYFRGLGGNVGVAGIVINKDDGTGEAQAWAKKVGIPVLASIPADEDIRRKSAAYQIVGKPGGTWAPLFEELGVNVAEAPPLRPSRCRQDELLNLFSSDAVGRDVVLEPATHRRHVRSGSRASTSRRSKSSTTTPEGPHDAKQRFFTWLPNVTNHPMPPPCTTTGLTNAGPEAAGRRNDADQSQPPDAKVGRIGCHAVPMSCAEPRRPRVRASLLERYATDYPKGRTISPKACVRPSGLSRRPAHASHRLRPLRLGLLCLWADLHLALLWCQAQRRLRPLRFRDAGHRQAVRGCARGRPQARGPDKYDADGRDQPLRAHRLRRAAAAAAEVASTACASSASMCPASACRPMPRPRTCSPAPCCTMRAARPSRARCRRRAAVAANSPP
jgi:hypothetical protein